MSETEEDVYEFHWLAKALPISAILLSIFVFASAPRNNPSSFTWFIFTLLLLSFVGSLLHFVLYKIYLTEEEIIIHRLMRDKEISYENIHSIDLSNPIYILNIHRRSESWPAFTVYGGIKNKRELAAKIVARAPDNAEIIDPYERLSKLEEK